MTISYFLGVIVTALLINYAQSSDYTAEDCKLLGFNKVNLLCSTCDKYSKFDLNEIIEPCKKCCVKDEDDLSTAPKRYAKAILEVCTCKFGAYPQIQAFIKSDRPAKYKNLSIRYARGLDPRIKLYDEENKLLDVLDIQKWNTDAVDEFFATFLVQ